MHVLENIMYQMSEFFLAPVLILLMLLFAYSIYSLGVFFVASYQRGIENKSFILVRKLGLRHDGAARGKSLKSYPLMALAANNPAISRDELDVAALKLLEGVRIVSRMAPMLGLIATMVPMGPALKSLADGDIQGISENLIIAFAAVIFGLVIASITFWIASIKKRWLADEIIAVTPLLEKYKQEEHPLESTDEVA